MAREAGVGERKTDTRREREVGSLKLAPGLRLDARIGKVLISRL